MRIGIDGNEANVINRVGSNVYAYEILHGLYSLDKSNTYKIYLKESPLDDLPKARENWSYIKIFPNKLTTQIGLPLQLYVNKPSPDIFFTPGHYAPRFSPIPTVVSILDVSYLLFPEYFKKSDLTQLTSWSKYSIKNAKKILTISEASKKDIIEHYEIDKSKIIVTYPGFTKFDENERSTDILEKNNMHNKYILFVGTLQPRKNLIRLLEAFKKLNLSDLKLVVVGKKGWLYNEIFQKVKEFNIENKVIFLNFVKRDDLGVLYKNAKCLALPSLYEGFGIPVVEAMSLGIPVVVSNVSSLPEIVGDAGILVDPYVIDDIAKGLEKALNLDQNERNRIIEKGKQRVKLFSWDLCVKKTLQVLEEVNNESNH